MAETCQLCGGMLRPVFVARLLDKHDVTYFQCGNCLFLRTQAPYWLEEAYAHALAEADTGVVDRNLSISRQLAAVLHRFFKRDGRFLDTAGGTGLMTRRMRDIGFDFRWEDPYCDNALARGFAAAPGSDGYEAVTSFEAIEHMPDPADFVTKALARSATRTLIFTTELFEPPLPPRDWWYYAFGAGQHIAFFTRETLEVLARKLGLRFLSHGGLHMFTGLPIAQGEYARAVAGARRSERAIRKSMASLTQRDSDAMFAKSARAPDAGLRTPVVVTLFNRPDCARRLVEHLSAVRPRTLLVVADGPRADKPGEAARCAESLAALERIDWPCEVLRNVAPANLGCRQRMASGIGWAFEQAEEAIVLEDDCMPSPSFFRYCEELLAKYRDEPRVTMISGGNFLPPGTPVTTSYYFSRYAHIGGWASWRRAWRHYDLSMARWPSLRDSGWLERLLGTDPGAQEWRANFDRAHAAQIDTWDYQWVYSCWLHEGLAAAPAQNLVRNEGFGPDATHTRDAPGDKVPQDRADMSFPLLHPVAPVRDAALDTLEAGWHAEPGKRRGLLGRALRSLRQR